MAEREHPSDRAGDFTWERSFDRASVERFLADAADKRGELQSELAVVRDRIATARQALERREADQRDALAALVAAAREQLAALEAEHAAALEAARWAPPEDDERGQRPRAGEPPDDDPGEPT